MADRYWVGGTGTWNTTSTTNWSATSGGAGGASVPTVADSVFFDQAGTYTVTMTGALACLDFNVTGGTVTFQNGTSPTLNVRGGWSTVAATVWNTTGTITFSATTSRTITTNAITIRSPLTFNGTGGTWTLQDNLTLLSTLTTTLTAGTLALSTYTLSTGLFAATGTSVRALNFGTGQLALTGNNATIFNITNATNFSTTGTVYINSTYTGSTGTRTFVTGFTEAQAAGYDVSTSGTSGIVISPSATDSVALTGSFNTVNLTGFTGTLTNTTRTLYGNLIVPASGGTFTGGTSITTFAGTGTETITTNSRTLDFQITFSGVGGTFRLLDNLTVGSTRRVSLDRGTLDLNNFTLSAGDFNASGSQARTLAFGTGQLALTGNNGDIISITTATNFSTTGTVYINLTYTGSTGTRSILWGSSSGATEVNIQNVSFSGTTGIVLSPSATDAIELSGGFNNIDFTGFTGTLINTTRTLYGNLIVPASGGTFTGGTSITTFAGTGTETITTNGRTINFPITFSGVGGTFQLQDALTLGSTRTFTLTAGTLDLNNFTLSAATFSSSGSTARSVAFGTTGQISLAGNGATIVDLSIMTNFSYTGTPRIVSTYTGATGTRIFNIGGNTGANSNNIFSITTFENPITTGGDGNASSTDDGGGGGGGIGGGIGTTISVNGGYTGGNANIASDNSLFTAVTNAGYTIGSGGGAAGGTSASPSNAINGGNATGFGAGGGGAGYYGGNGGNGFLGGGGGGAAGFNGTARTGGNGGNGAIVLQMTVSGTPTYNVLTSGTSYSIPANTTFIKIWAIGAGGGGAGATADATAGGGGGAGGISIMSSANTGTITYSIGTGGAGGSGINNGLAGGNTTVTFDGTTLTSTGGAGGGYNSAIVSGVGGTGTDAFTVIPTGIAVSIATDAIGLSGGFNNVDLTGFQGTFSSGIRSIYGNFTIPSTGGSLSAGTGVTSFVGSGSKTLSTGGRTLDFPVTIDGANGTFQLLSNFAIGSTRTFTLTAGALDLNNFILSAATFSSNSGNTRSIAFGSTGQITLGGNNATIVDFTNMTNFTYTGTPKIYSTYTGATGTRTFNFGNAPATGATSTNVFDLSIGTSGDGLVISTGTDILALIGSFNNFNLTGLSQTINNNGRFIYGDFTVPASGGTLTAGTSVLSFVGVSGTENITTNGRTLDFPITFDGAATFRLQSALLIGSTRVLTHNNGTIDLNGYTLTVGTAYTTGTGTKNLTFNGGSLVCPANTATAFNNAVPGGFTTTAGTGTGTISLTAATAKTFVGNNAIYNCDIDQGGAGVLTITGFNTFNRIKSSYANTTANASIILPTGNTTTLAGIVGGSASNKMLDLSPATATAAPFRANVIISNSSIQTASYIQANSIIFNASELQNPSSQTSVLFDGTGDYLTIPNNSAFNFGSGNFTIECWVYPTTVSPANQVLIALYGYSNDRRSWYLGLNAANLELRWDANGLTPVDAIITSTSSPFVANRWHHVAFVRSGNTFSGYVNGVLVVSGTSAVTLYNNTVDPVSIGTVGPTYTDFLNGYISNVRIIKGTALYTTNFTPTTSPLTAIANTSLLTCQSATLVDNGPNNFTVTAVGDSTVSPFSPFGNFSDGTTPWRLYLANSINNGDTLGAVFQEYSNTAPIVYYITRGTSFTVPADWNNSNNAIHIYGAGGGSSGSYVPNSSGNRLGSAGGGGGGYTQVLNFTATPGSSVSYSIGLGGAAGSANTLSSSGGAGGNTTFAGIYTANGGGGSSITSTTTTAGTGGTGATANGGVGGLGGGAASATNNSSGGGGGGSGGPNGAGANGGTGTIGANPSTCAGGGGGGSSGGTNGTSANTATPGTGGNNFAGTRAGGIGGLGTTFGGISGGRERGRASYDILGSVGGAGGGGGGGAAGPGVRDELNIGGGAGGSGATDSDFANPGTSGQSGGIIIVYYPSAVVSGNFSNMFLLF